MKWIAPIVAACLLLACNTKQEKMAESKTYTFFVGTYTNGESEGIYEYELLPDGSMKQVRLAAKSENPSFLAFSNDRKQLLAVNELDVEGNGFVQSFAVEADSLRAINKQPSGGAHPCFVTVNENGMVAVANYSGGNIGLLQLSKHGELSELLQVEQHEGGSTHARQEAPHAHSVYFIDKNKIVSADLGTNELWFSTIGEETTETEQFSMQAEAGPRHLAFPNQGERIYVLNELDNTVSLITKNEHGGYELQSSIATLPEDFTEYNTSADIHFSPDGKFLYTSNRGHNSLAIFRVQEDGSLQLVGHEATRGQTPRNFSLSPNGEYLLVANQDSNHLVSFQRDAETGLLTYVAEVAAPSPVCILF